MELTEEHIIRSTSPDDLTMEQRHSLSLKFADLVLRAMGYERDADPGECPESDNDKTSGKGRRVKR